MAPTTLVSNGIGISAAKVAKLAGGRLAEKEFYQQFLELLPKPDVVVGAAAWRVEANRFHQIAGTTRTSPGNELRVSQGLYGQHLLQVVRTRSYQCLTAPAASSDAPARILTFPVVCDESVPVVIDVYAREDTGESADSEEMQHFVDQTSLLCAVASLYHQSDLNGGDPFATSLVQLATDVHQSLDGQQVCYSLANESRRILGCDRVSVLRRHGRRYSVEAISGQDSVNRRANVVRALEELVEVVAPARASFWYPSDSAELAPEVQVVLEDYLECSSVRRVAIVPLLPKTVRQGSESTGDEPAKTWHDAAAPLGALVIEEMRDDRAVPDLHRKLHAVAEQGSIALQNAATHESILFLPWMRFLGRQWEWMRGSGYRATWMALVGLAALGLFLRLWPADLTIRCDGEFLPRERRHVFAPEAGVVADLAVEHGSFVKEGDRLMTLRNHELNLALEALDGELAKVQARLGALRAQRYAESPDGATHDERLAMAAEERSLQSYLESLQTQKQLAHERLATLRITSPIAGKVLTWNLEERIRDRPIERGQALLEIARTDGPWEIQLHVPDRYASDLLDPSRTAQGLPVTFLIASDVSREYQGTVDRVAMATVLEPNQGQMIRVTVTVPEEESVAEFQAGTSVQAKIHCGRKPIGYVWFRDLWRFIHRELLFRWF